MTDVTNDFNLGLFTFLDSSPTPFHAVMTMKSSLDANGFSELKEGESWCELKTGGYYVTRNDSSIIALYLADQDIATSGFKMAGAHTDSPCLKVKPQPEISKHTLWQLGVEVYGGALLSPWFDRDLSMAGRVSYENSQGQLAHTLVNFDHAVAVIPNLAIHLDREANKDHTINPQTHLPPIICQLAEDNTKPFRDVLAAQALKQNNNLDIKQVLDYEIALYDTQKAAYTGLNQDFISSARLDNLLSCYVGLQSLLASEGKQSVLLVCNDHEEVGSVSASGADGNFLHSVLQRLTQTPENYQRMIDHSIMISVDNAHGIHPNYSDKHDTKHGPLLNHGPVIKTNANQRYASNSETSALFRQLCQQSDVPVQDFVVRSDMACGSTIGPITASNIGIQTLDIGVPTFAMHSIRELAGSRDTLMLHKVLTAFFSKQ